MYIEDLDSLVAAYRLRPKQLKEYVSWRLYPLDLGVAEPKMQV